MKTLKLHIEGNFQDGYLYGGQLFLIENSGRIQSISLLTLLASNFKYGTEEFNFLELALTRNDWFINYQGKSIFNITDFKAAFNKLWKKYSKIDYSIKLPHDEIKDHDEIGTPPVFDFQLYGMRLYVGNRDGLYEAPISIDRNVKLNKPLTRVFDARTTQISAKSGSIMISSNTEGLFHGRLSQYENDLEVLEKPIKNKSIRTSWTGYDLINYEDHKHFDYLVNDYSKTDERQYLYSRGDESSQKISIDKIGEKTISLESLIKNLNFKEDDIVYSFNSSRSCFFFLKSGEFINTYFKKDSQNDDVKLSANLFRLPNGLKSNNKILKPISTKIVPGGCIIEYFDKVVLVQNGKKILLESKPVTAIKTFPQSLRYKNMVAIFDGEGVSLHCMYPF